MDWPFAQFPTCSVQIADVSCMSFRILQWREVRDRVLWAQWRVSNAAGCQDNRFQTCDEEVRQVSPFRMHTHLHTHMHTIFSYYPCEDLPFTDIIINTSNKCHVYTYITLTLTSITKKIHFWLFFSPLMATSQMSQQVQNGQWVLSLWAHVLLKGFPPNCTHFFGIYKLLNPIMCDYKIYLLTPSQQTHCDW